MAGSLLWSGVPDLSREVIERHYLPLLSSGATRRMLETADVAAAGKR